jgi:hypothetical protein
LGEDQQLCITGIRNDNEEDDLKNPGHKAELQGHGTKTKVFGQVGEDRTVDGEDEEGAACEHGGKMHDSPACVAQVLAHAHNPRFNGALRRTRY